MKLKATLERVLARSAVVLILAAAAVIVYELGTATPLDLAVYAFYTVKTFFWFLTAIMVVALALLVARLLLHKKTTKGDQA